MISTGVSISYRAPVRACYPALVRRKIVGFCLLLLGSEIFGIVAGDRFFHLCLQMIPPAFLTGFNRGTTHAAFVTYGVVLGGAIFVWSVALLGVGRFWGARVSRQAGRAAESRAAGTKKDSSPDA